MHIYICTHINILYICICIDIAGFFFFLYNLTQTCIPAYKRMDIHLSLYDKNRHTHISTRTHTLTHTRTRARTPSVVCPLFIIVFTFSSIAPLSPPHRVHFHFVYLYPQPYPILFRPHHFLGSPP